jgi:hypothetical protein
MVSLASILFLKLATPVTPRAEHHPPSGPGFRIRTARFWPLLLLLLAGPALSARIEVSLDRNPVPQNESFTLIFSAGESPDGDPDFSPLEQNFEILGQNQSTQFSFNNGHASRSIEWRLSVMAKKTGTLDIPPIAFGADRSEPFSVTVTPGRTGGKAAEGGGEIFMEVEAEPKNPYVQAQTLYTLRVLSRVPIGEARLGAPEAEDALIEKLDGEHQGLTTRNGVQYRITEIRYAVFPQKSGRLRIEPARLEAQIPTRGHFPFGQSGRSQRLQSDAVELEVRPIPPEFAGKHWLPAAHLELEDSWAGKPPQIGSGEPITRTLALRAEGATVGLLPELNPSAPSSGDIKQYPDQPSLHEEKRGDGVASVRQEKTALIASQPGSYRMPAVEIPWWNTKTDRMEVARLPERILTVLPPTHSQAHEPPQPAPEAVPPPGPALSAPQETGLRPEGSALNGNPWFWLALLFGLGWLATALGWWLSRGQRNMQPPPPKSDEAMPERQCLEAVERACRANDPAATKRALAAWAAERWPGSEAAELERRCGGDLGREIGLLNRALYAPGGTEWRGEGLWRRFRTYTASARPAEKTAAATELEPLYKL